MSEGFSFASFGSVINVCEDTLYEWANPKKPTYHAEFSEAKKIAFQKNLFFWEKTGINGVWDQITYDERTGKPIKKISLNSAVWIFNMKNRHRWRDRQDEAQQGPSAVDPREEEIEALSTEDQLKLAGTTDEDENK